MKIRSDSWYADIPEDTLWKLYDLTTRNAWYEVVRIANEEMDLNVKVSHSAYYRWLDYMRSQHSERRLAQARIAALEADKLAKDVGLSDETAIKAYKSLAAECALKSDAKTATRFMQLANDLIDRQAKSRDLARKDEELKLAVAKFEAAEKRLNAASKAIADETLSDADRIARIKSIFGMS